MKAQVLQDVNDMCYKNIEEPQLKDGWVLVRVKAAGVCGSDIPRIYKTGAHVHPIILVILPSTGCGGGFVVSGYVFIDDRPAIV